MRSPCSVRELIQQPFYQAHLNRKLRFERTVQDLSQRRKKEPQDHVQPFRMDKTYAEPEIRKCDETLRETTPAKVRET